MKVYITKYALTRGIIDEKEVEICKNIPNMVECREAFFHDYFHKPDWHETKEEAIKRAELMKNKKIESLKKQIQKLEKIKF
jgi:hypothetical protein